MFKICTLATIAFFAAATTSLAANTVVVHVSPNGSGKQSGLDTANALPFFKLNSAIRHAQESVQIEFSPGAYTVTEPIKIIDSARAPEITLVGSGSRFKRSAATTKNFPLFLAGRGAISISDIEASGFKSFIDTLENAKVNDVRLSGIKVDQAEIAVRIVVTAKGEARNWTVANFEAVNYGTAGIRVSGRNARYLTVSNFSIDGGGLRRNGDCFRGGIQIYAGASHVKVEDGSVGNNVSDCGKYHQGDGIEATDDDAAPDNITISNVVSFNNRDGNFDLKATNVKLVNVHSKRGSETRFAFRLWRYQYECAQCKSDGGAVADMFVSNATVNFHNSDFQEETPSVHCDDRGGQQSKSISFAAPKELKVSCSKN